MSALDEDAWLTIGPADALAIDARQEFSLPDGRFVLVCRTAEGYFACSADCPHQNTPLIEGTLEGCVLTCPLHFWEWDIRTGEPLDLAEVPLPVFDVRDGAEGLQIRERPALAWP